MAEGKESLRKSVAFWISIAAVAVSFTTAAISVGTERGDALNKIETVQETQRSHSEQHKTSLDSIDQRLRVIEQDVAFIRGQLGGGS